MPGPSVDARPAPRRPRRSDRRGRRGAPVEADELRLAHALCVSSPARLGAPRRRRRERIVRPGVARIAPAHLGAHRRVGAAPEARQIARDLHRPVPGREQFDHQRNAPARDARMLRRARTAPARGSRSSGPPRPRSRSQRACRSAPRNASALRYRAGGAGARAAARAGRIADSSARSRETAVLPARAARANRRFAASAASDRSGHSSPSARRRNITRSRHCVSALVHGSLSRPRARCLRRACARSRRSARPCASARPARCAPSRRERRARRLERLLVERDFVAALDAIARNAPRSLPSAIGAASTMRAFAALPVSSRDRDEWLARTAARPDRHCRRGRSRA